VEGETVKKLLGKLRGLVPEEMLLSLMSQLARELPSHAFCVAALIILQPSSERALEEAFRCFAELLSQVALDAGSIDLAEEVSERLSSSQLSLMNEALGACPREGGDRLDGLRLKEAKALLREGKVEAAICLVNSLRISPSLENEVLRFFDEAGLSSGKVLILEQRLSAKLEEISRDSPSVAETLSVIHQLLFAKLHSRKSEATSQSLISLKTELLNETAAQLGQQTSHALIVLDARIQRLEEHAQMKEVDCQETLFSLRTKVEALTEELVKAGEEILHVKKVQDASIQRLDEKLKEAEAATDECLISLKAELRALHEQAVISGEEAKGVQSFIEQSQKAEAAAQEVFSSLKAEVVVISTDLAQAVSQCRSAQSANEVTLRSIEGKSQKAEVTTQRDLKKKAETLTEEHLKTGEEVKHVKQVKRARNALIQSLDKKLNTVEAATQLALNILRGDFGTLREDVDHALSQCKQVQEAMLQSLEEQSQETEANALKLNRAVTSLQDTLYHPHEITLPTFIYSYERYTDQLHRTSLVTGEHSSHRVPSHTFKPYCRWSEVPGGSLLITGGSEDYEAVREVVRIDVGTFEVSTQPHMLTPRYSHAAVYHTPHLYVLGGVNNSALSECERYVCAENRWEALPPLPRVCSGTSGVVVESSLYALGGFIGLSHLDLVQKLSLESLTWELMQFRLPHADCAIPCFKLRNIEVYLVVNKTLCSFTGLEVRPLKTLTEGISSCHGASYYRRGTLYCSDDSGAVRSLEIGSIVTSGS
jgi:hypothetical protein